MKIYLSIIWFISIVVTISGCQDGSNYTILPKTPEQLRIELKEQEINNPLTYLSVDQVTLQPKRKGFLNMQSDGSIIQGDFINSATLAKFKDITIKVSYYSQTQTLISERSYVLYQYSPAGSKTHFSGKIDSPPPAESIFTCMITGATPVNE